MVAVFSYLHVFYSQDNKDDNIFLAFWIFFAIIATFYSYYWDLKMDWALLDFN
jgi:hypothetical protein